MKRVCVVAACAAGVSLCAAGARGNLLVNGDLELPADGGDGSMGNIATGWTLDEPDMTTMGAPVNSAEFRSFGNHTPGGERGLWFRAFEGGLNADSPTTVNATLYQDVPAVPGAMYEVSAWFRFEQNYSGVAAGSATETKLGLQFFAAGGTSLGGAAIVADFFDVGDNTWRLVSREGVAPANAATVRVYAQMLGGFNTNINPQSAFVDDFVLIPTPGAAGVLALAGLAGLRRRR